MKAALIACVLALLAVPCMAGQRSADELTFSLGLFNANEGPTVWNANGEYLIGVTKGFLVGPAVSLFDAGSTDGGLFGVAGKLRLGKQSGFWVGGRLAKSTGDSADVFDYSADARAGVDFGGPRGFATFYAQQSWVQGNSGERTGPEGTSVIAGLGLRFGK